MVYGRSLHVVPAPIRPKKTVTNLFSYLALIAPGILPIDQANSHEQLILHPVSRTFYA